MFLYWGYSDSGKDHIKNYAIHNDKTVLIWQEGRKSITKIYTTVHHQGTSWRDETVRRIIYHYIDGFRKCEKKIDKIFQYIPYQHHTSSINPNFSKSNYYHSNYYQLKDKRNYSKEDIKKYTQIEYINSNIYYDIIAKYIRQICEDIPREMLDYDEIFKDVDLVSFVPPEYVIEDNLELLKSSINIVPYKSNILDCIISKLDLYTGAEDLLEVYNSDKKKIWHYLDEYCKELDDVIDLLKKYNIPYQMFDLDTDSYKDTFGWEIELPRDYSHRKDSWQDNERYDMVQDIAKEYVQR